MDGLSSVLCEDGLVLEKISAQLWGDVMLVSFLSSRDSLNFLTRCKYHGDVSLNDLKL